MTILFNNFKAEPNALIEKEIEAAARVIRSGHFVLGPEVANFERLWASYSGSEHAIGVGNGMDALEIGIRALDIGAGDEVITTPMTALATVFAIQRAGATPVLADIDPGTGLLSMESVQRCISKRTKAVLLVHLYGQVQELKAWQRFCLENKIALLEDCAQSHGAKWDGMGCGNFGEWGAFSFYPTKNLGAIGDGGALITNREDLARQASILRNYGQMDRYVHPVFGFNSRLDEIQAAILLERLAYLDQFIERRRTIANFYHEHIQSDLVRCLAKPISRENHVYHLFVVKTALRDALQQHLDKHKVATLIHYPICAHQQPSMNQCSIDPRGLLLAEQHAMECLSLPCNPHLTDGEIEQVIAVVNAFQG